MNNINHDTTTLSQFDKMLETANNLAKTNLNKANYYKKLYEDLLNSSKENEIRLKGNILKTSIAFSVNDISENMKDDIRTTLESWSNDIYQYRDSEIDRSNSCDSDYYKREREKNVSDSHLRMIFIETIIESLYKEQK